MAGALPVFGSFARGHARAHISSSSPPTALNPNKEPTLPRPITFAPNVTPGTWSPPDAEDSLHDLRAAAAAAGSDLPPLLSAGAPTDTEAETKPRRRQPPGKRRSLGYIPRPPNAFMLFRADFVKQKHVPGSIEANHVSLSKIIGECFLP